MVIKCTFDNILLIFFGVRILYRSAHYLLTSNFLVYFSKSSFFCDKHKTLCE